MPVSDTPPLPFTRAIRTPAGQITIILNRPYPPPLHLGIINILEVNTATPIAGTITPGAGPQQGGMATLQASQHLLSAPLAAVAHHSVVTLSYETGTLAPVDIALS